MTRDALMPTAPHPLSEWTQTDAFWHWNDMSKLKRRARRLSSKRNYAHDSKTLCTHYATAINCSFIFASAQINSFTDE
jgi:hypothetical protein